MVRGGWMAKLRLVADAISPIYLPPTDYVRGRGTVEQIERKQINDGL